MTLPRRLELIGRDQLGITPAGDVESLRTDLRHLDAMELPANREIVLDDIAGDAMEIVATIDPKGAPVIEMNVLRSPDGEEYTRVSFFEKRGYRNRGHREGPQYSVVSLDSAHSSILPDAMPRAPETAQVALDDGEPLELRVFVDRSVVEVFVNGKQCLAVRVYPGRDDSVGVSLCSRGRDAQLRSLDAWRMAGIY